MIPAFFDYWLKPNEAFKKAFQGARSPDVLPWLAALVLIMLVGSTIGVWQAKQNPTTLEEVEKAQNINLQIYAVFGSALITLVGMAAHIAISFGAAKLMGGTGTLAQTSFTFVIGELTYQAIFPLSLLPEGAIPGVVRMATNLVFTLAVFHQCARGVSNSHQLNYWPSLGAVVAGAPIGWLVSIGLAVVMAA